MGKEDKVPHFAIGKSKKTKNSLEIPEENGKPKWEVVPSQQDLEFQKFWSENGEKIVMQKWKEKYGDYMEENEEKNDIIDTIDKSQENEPENHTKSWNELWQDLWTAICTEEYEKFTNLKNSDEVPDMEQVIEDLTQKVVIQDEVVENAQESQKSMRGLGFWIEKLKGEEIESKDNLSTHVNVDQNDLTEAVDAEKDQNPKEIKTNTEVRYHFLKPKNSSFESFCRFVEEI